MIKKNSQYSERSESPRKKKLYGQHFLRTFSIVENIVKQVDPKGRNILEIGCGDGFLTSGILNLSRCKKLVSVEVDPDWFFFVKHKFIDARLELLNQDILEFDFESLRPLAPIILLANLPYNLTFPILELLIKYKSLFSDIVIMIQEEVAQRLVAKTGRTFGAISLFIQNNFEMKLLEKIGPENFSPAPKVTSRTIYLKPINGIEYDEQFWTFVRQCFKTPRQTLKNNLKKTGFSLEAVNSLTSEILGDRSQKLTLSDFLNMWQKLKSYGKDLQ